MDYLAICAGATAGSHPWLTASSYAMPALFFGLFLGLAHRNILGDIIAGTVFGFFWEFSTARFWDYRLGWKLPWGTPPAVIINWGVLFAVVVFLSERLYKSMFHRAQVELHDPRIFLTDVVAGLCVGCPAEWLGLYRGLWTYKDCPSCWSGWGPKVPILGLPSDIFIGYALMMLVAPTFVRYWQGALHGRRPPAAPAEFVRGFAARARRARVEPERSSFVDLLNHLQGRQC